MHLQGLMKFYYCLLKILRKNQNVMDGRKDGRTDVKTVYLPQTQFVIINVFANFDDILSLPVQVIKEKPKRCRQFRNYKGQSITLKGVPLALIFLL